MGAVLIVPGRLVEGLREGVRRKVFDGVEAEIEALVFSEEPFEEVLRRHGELVGRLNSARALLDQVGWRGCRRGAQADVEVDLERYGPLVLEGLSQPRLAGSLPAPLAAGRGRGCWVLDEQ
jgi:hypothetical protein